MEYFLAQLLAHDALNLQDLGFQKKVIKSNPDPMTSLSLKTTSRVWSCNTLSDGMDRLLAEANEVEQEEESLEKLIQDLQRTR